MNNILHAISKKFSDVPKKGFAVGAWLDNRGKRYINIGSTKETIWKMIMPLNKK